MTSRPVWSRFNRPLPRCSRTVTSASMIARWPIRVGVEERLGGVLGGDDTAQRRAALAGGELLVHLGQLGECARPRRAPAGSRDDAAYK